MSEKWGKLTKEESGKATYWGEREESCNRYGMMEGSFMKGAAWRQGWLALHDEDKQ